MVTLIKNRTDAGYVAIGLHRRYPLLQFLQRPVHIGKHGQALAALASQQFAYLCHHEATPSRSIWVNAELPANDRLSLTLYTGNLARRGRMAPRLFGPKPIVALSGSKLNLLLLFAT